MVVSLPMPGFSNVCHSVCVWPTALKLGCVTNLDTLSRDGVHLFGWFLLPRCLERRETRKILPFTNVIKK